MISNIIKHAEYRIKSTAEKLNFIVCYLVWDS